MAETGVDVLRSSPNNDLAFRSTTSSIIIGYTGAYTVPGYESVYL
jgi:hypothetical protein